MGSVSMREHRDGFAYVLRSEPFTTEHRTYGARAEKQSMRGGVFHGKIR
jgi:hypothetical protein